MTKTMKFKCTLESDIVLSQTSSSVGNLQSLDFIPGNNFLGIAASRLYQDGSFESLELFHSGKVRFGDAHPSVGGIRGLKVPASMYYPKLGSASEECYIHHLTDYNSTDIKAKQLKQCRYGFYSFDEKKGSLVDVQKNLTIKTAYDEEHRRSKDGLLFCYESLCKGLVLYFEVESELDEKQNKRIADALCGKRHIGHSRSAEFGAVVIEESPYEETLSSKSDTTMDEATVYADGRLIFLDENGEPTFQPTAKDLGFDGGTIDWSKSQIRTFQYAPWNGRRHSYEAERCGIEKGSVFVIKLNGASCPEKSQYIGAYRNEGFGKVIYNPVFLKADEHGRAFCVLEKKSTEKHVQANTPRPDSPLIDFLSQTKQSAECQQTVYQIVQDEAAQLEPYFKKGRFASQWGSIRSLAMIASNSKQLIELIDSYLDHGVAKEKWEERSRKKRLDDFMNENQDNDLINIMVNLASVMAKKCKAREED